MTSIFESDDLPADLQLAGTSFYSRWGTARDIRNGEKEGQQFVAFVWDVMDTETYSIYSVVAIRTGNTINPATWLSRTSGLQLERVGEWVFVSEAGRHLQSDGLDSLIVDAFSLVGYADGFPQNP